MIANTQPILAITDHQAFNASGVLLVTSASGYVITRSQPPP